MSTPSAVAMSSTLSIDTFRSRRSIEPIYVRCTPAKSARASCDRLCAARRARMRRASLSLADSTFALCPDMGIETRVLMT